ncbi:MAG: acetyl-CoA carboxylase biotin carboxylase subunit [Anaerolineae bacterium]
MIRSILIANRGEIACRIIRTCRQMGIHTVAVYSDADATALHTTLADEAVYLGESAAHESYLNIDKIIAAAQRTGADAIHPGYGFLSENAAFAQAVIAAGITFIGPSPAVIEAMGDKRRAKLLLNNIPLIPGYTGEDQSDAAFQSAAAQIGFPLMVKATAGGGGKGMRRVLTPDELLEALASARREARQAFGDETLMLEKLLLHPRHVEIQILGDQHGHVIALGERECSVQRRFQKMIEEAPCVALTPEIRAAMSAAAVHIGQQLGYQSAGTIEFLLDSDGQFYFMEMNTRLQVEHPVTEMVYGLDLVRLQILIAEGQPLSTLYTPREPHGHAIELRLYAEDPDHDFLPATGKLTYLNWHAPETVRIDTGVRSGDEVTIHYDPMLAKLIAWGETREQAIRLLDYTLKQIVLLGVRNNLTFLRRIITHPDFIAGNLSTSFIADHPDLRSGETPISPVALIAAALQRTGGEQWRNNPYRPIRQQFRHQDNVTEVLVSPGCVHINDAQYKTESTLLDPHTMHLTINGHRQRVAFAVQGDIIWVHVDGQTIQLHWVNPLPVAGARRTEHAGSLRAPMPGQIVSVHVEIGQTVQKDTLLVTMEAMKMEHRILAPYDGVVAALHYGVGEAVQVEAVLLDLQQSPTEI